jgi:hypothetical protein
MEDFFYNCSKDYVESIDPSLYNEIGGIIAQLPKRGTQAEINTDLFWLLTDKGWAYDTLSRISDSPPKGIEVRNEERSLIEKENNRSLCLTSKTLNSTWHSDFAKRFESGLVQIEAQFGKVESMFKDFCGFTIARYERRLTLGIEIILLEPTVYFSHRKNSIGGMAYFEIAKKTLPAIGLNCPIWLIGIKE